MLAASIYSVYLAWQTGLSQSRAETVSRLMATRTPPRSTETPGINAWMSWAILENLRGDDKEINSFRRLLAPQPERQLPAGLSKIADALRTPLPRAGAETVKTRLQEPDAPPRPLEFRNVWFADPMSDASTRFVVTARNDPIVREHLASYVDRVATHLTLISPNLNLYPDLHLEQINWIRSVRVARIYVLSEYETLISLPLPVSPAEKNDDLFNSEFDEFHKNPLSPTFVSNNFFFNFEFEKPLDSQAWYSGAYIDLGGLGLVASVTIPVSYDSTRSVIGADLAFDIDWKIFAESLSPEFLNTVVQVGYSDSKAWTPWNEFNHNAVDAPRDLKSELATIAEQESLGTESVPRKSVYLASTQENGDLMALQVDRSTWLLMLGSGNEIRLPWLTMLLTGLVFLGLLIRMEHSRRLAVRAQDAALGEMVEKQNLLDTMQVPLMVVDPNTDELVYCNRAAAAIGMSPGDVFGNRMVAQDEETQAHYQRTQTLNEERRRAYGVPIKITQTGGSDTTPDDSNDSSTGYAIVRSVGVKAPISSLNANERHRLGILFVIDEKKDLSLLLNQRLAAVKFEERRKLSGLMNHGVDSLARILCYRLQAGDPTPTDRDFNVWLSSYLSERIRMIAWTLDHWGQMPPTHNQIIIERKNVEETISRISQILDKVALNRDLRERLHWNNGILSSEPCADSVELGNSETSKGRTERVNSTIRWHSKSCFSTPYDGVFGFFLSELLANAIRHGKPGSRIEFSVDENLIRNELAFEVRNQVNRTEAPTRENLKPFGGINLLLELARISGWTVPEISCEQNMFAVCWRVPMIRRKAEGQGD